MDKILALDLGTTNCKALVLGQDGRPYGSFSAGYELTAPHPGRAEQDPWQIWRAVQSCLTRAAQSTQADGLIGLCLSGAMHSLLPVDSQGQPLAPATTWADGRAAAQSARLRAECSEVGSQALYQRTGCPLQSLYHPARLRWYLEEMPDLVRQTALFCGIKDWILYQLTGVWVSDLSLASSTGLMDIHRAVWDAEAIHLAGISPNTLPELVSPRQVVGSLPGALAASLGLPAGLPVVAGAADGGLANLGAGALRAGQSVITVGTSGAVRRMVAEPWLDPRARTWCYLLLEGRWYSGGAINNGGLALEWVREMFYPHIAGPEGFSRLLQDAVDVLPGAEGLLALPYLTGERTPHWDPAARAVLSGLGLEHTRAHVARAVLEGVAYCLADVWEALGPSQEGALLTGSITRSPLWSQILADVLETPLTLMDAADASVIGAGFLGLWALGRISSLEAAPVPAGGHQVQPNPATSSTYRHGREQFHLLYNRTFVL